MSVCVYVCMYVCMYIYIYIYTQHSRKSSDLTGASLTLRYRATTRPASRLKLPVGPQVRSFVGARRVLSDWLCKASHR